VREVGHDGGVQDGGRRTLELIVWPYHDGRRDFGMGRGAAVLAGDERLRAGVRAAGCSVCAEWVAAVDERWPEIARVIELDRRLADRVRAARGRGAFPLVLAGNCNSCLGTVAGIGAERLGVVWFDAHADFDTPEDNVSGFFDVMALSMLTGTGWSALRRTIPGFAAVAECHVVLGAVRDLLPYQRLRLERSQVRTVPGALDAAALRARLDALRSDVGRVYLHVDLDALDLTVGRANEYAAAGGPTLDDLLAAIKATFARFRVEAAAVSAYDPRFDTDGQIAAAARRVVIAIAQGARAQTDGRR
jgi:arginase